MSTVIVPSLTNQMILAYFEFFVDAELRKRRNGAFDFQCGAQEGAISGILIQFGGSVPQSSDDEWRYDLSWLNITVKIVEENLDHWALVMDNNDELSNDDEKTLKKDIKEAVAKYALSHVHEMSDALKRFI